MDPSPVSVAAMAVKTSIGLSLRAEAQAFNNWGANFSELRQGEFRSRQIQNQFLTFWVTYEVMGLGCIFAVIGLMDQTEMTTGGFLAFVAAFSGLMASLFALARSLITVFSVAPLYRRAAPILRTVSG